MWSYEEDNERDTKRTLTEREKRILYENAKGRCQNPACGKKIEYDEMVAGHKKAWSKGGSTTLVNSVCLCYRCSRKQKTDNWTTFLKKQGVEDPKIKLRKLLNALTVVQLKFLAKKHKIVIRGQIEENWFISKRIAPSKSQYITKLLKIVTQEEITNVPKIARRRRQSSYNDSWW